MTDALVPPTGTDGNAQSDNAGEPTMPPETLRERVEADGRLWHLACTEMAAQSAQQVRNFATGLSNTLTVVDPGDEYSEGVRATVTEVLTSLSELADLIERGGDVR